MLMVVLLLLLLMFVVYARMLTMHWMGCRR